MAVNTIISNRLRNRFDFKVSSLVPETLLKEDSTAKDAKQHFSRSGIHAVTFALEIVTFCPPLS